MSTTIDIDITVTGTVTLTLTSEDIAKIVREHKGDYQKYIDNLSWSKYDIEDVEEDSRDYSQLSVQNAIAKYVKRHDVNSSQIPLFVAESDNRLEMRKTTKEDFERCEKNMTQLNIPREHMKNLVHCCDDNNPKAELNYIRLDDENIVSSDTKKLCIVKNATGVANAYLPKFLAEYYLENEKADMYFEEKEDASQSVWIHCDGEYFRENIDITNMKYPDYKRIEPKGYDCSYSFEELLENRVFIEEGCFDGRVMAVWHGELKEPIFIDEENLPIGYEELSFNFNFEKGSIVCFSSGDVKFILMPLLLETNDYYYRNAVEFFKDKKEIGK